VIGVRTTRKFFTPVMLLMLATLASLTHADQSTIPHIGALVLPQSSGAFETGLREGLQQLGYIEGKSIIIDWRRARFQENDAQRLAIELARSKLDVIVVYGTPAARAALQVNRTTPIVFGSGDPVGSGLVPNLTHPGGNATGISAVMTESTGKRLELLREIAPRARRIACLTNPEDALGTQQFQTAQQAGPSVGMQVVELDARNETQLRRALAQLSRSGFDGILITADVLFEANNREIADAIRQARVPAVFPFRDYHEDGALMSYGPDLRAAGRMIATYVDKILKGAKPGSLPIEQHTKFELVVNLKTAKALGITIPESILLRADEVIR